MLDCHLGGDSLGKCLNQCDTNDELYKPVFFCGQMYCLGVCEWDCC